MMNSTTDDFGENPFRSGGGSNDDIFYNGNQQQQPSSGPAGFQQPQPPMQQQQQHQPQANAFAPAPVMTDSSFALPSGPMQSMNSPQQGQQGYQNQNAGQMNAQSSGSWWGNCMMCLNLETYKVYFDIDVEDIVTRVKAVMLDFYKPEHFRNNVLGTQKTDTLKGPDLYGPFWITMTLIFFVGVTSNIHDYLHKNDIENFDYDITHLLRAASVLCSFSFVIPVILWVTTQCLGIQALLLVEWVCLYGYSLVPFLPAVLLCIIPSGLVSWLLLGVATAISCLLVVRNAAAPLLSGDAGSAKAPPLILAISGTHFIFYFVLKFSFYHHANSKK